MCLGVTLRGQAAVSSLLGGGLVCLVCEPCNLLTWPQGYWHSGAVSSSQVQWELHSCAISAGVSKPRGLRGERFALASFHASGLGGSRVVGRGACSLEGEGVEDDVAGRWVVPSSVLVERLGREGFV